VSLMFLSVMPSPISIDALYGFRWVDLSLSSPIWPHHWEKAQSFHVLVLGREMAHIIYPLDVLASSYSD
jgi:hypothetical protein